MAGLSSPTDWIWSLGERFKLPALNPPPLLHLTWWSICSNMIGTMDFGRWVFAPVGAASMKIGLLMPRSPLRKACEVVHYNVWECHHGQHQQINSRPFWPLPLKQWQASCLNFCPIWGAIKNHLRLYKRLQRLFQNFLWRRWDEKVFGFPEEVTKGSSLHLLYSPGCYSILAYLRHLKDPACSHTFSGISQTVTRSGKRTILSKGLSDGCWICG